MQNNKWNLWNILKEMVYGCAIFLASMVALGIILNISVGIFRILLYVIVFLGMAGAMLFCMKILLKILHFIQQRNKEK